MKYYVYFMREYLRTPHTYVTDAHYMALIVFIFLPYLHDTYDAGDGVIHKPYWTVGKIII